MTAQEIMNKLTILKSTIEPNKAWGAVALGAIFIIFVIVDLLKSKIKDDDPMLPNSFCALIAIIGAMSLTFGLIDAVPQPIKITLQISAVKEEVTIEDLTTHFDATDIALDNEQIVCVLSPTNGSYGEVSKWLKKNEGATNESTEH